MNELQRRDLDVYWHPCSQMRDYENFPPLPIAGAEGSHLILEDGTRMIDAISSWWCKAFGHRHPVLMQALIDQCGRFDHVISANTCNADLVRLCERLLAMANGYPHSDWGPGCAPGRLAGRYGKVFLADNGSTAMEIGLKMALQAQSQRGMGQRTEFAAMRGGYHGETVATLSVGDCELYSRPYRPLMFPTVFIEDLPLRTGPNDPLWMDASAEWPSIQSQLEQKADTLAGIVYEPVLQGAGGMRIMSPDLLRRLRAWADANDCLLIADEIATGFGRCGSMLASQLAGEAGMPDLCCVSKGLTGGALPLSAVLIPDAIYHLFEGEYHSYKAFLHSNTWTGNALAVAVANAVLDVMVNEDILAGVQHKGPKLRSGLERLAAERPYLGNLRQVGMVAAMDITGVDPKARTGFQVYQEACRRGALLRPLGDTCYLFPPLNVEDQLIDDMVEILGQSLDAVMP